MGSSKNKPEKLGGILKKLFSNIGIEEGLEQQDALLIWEEVVGEKIAKISKPESVKHGRLYVKILNSMWRQEVHYYKHEIIIRINEKLKREAIKDIIFL
ncbi:MAG: DUF721 domain-containing protein [bacterium]|nr:DUF721 domain-containing protein [bacterium]